MNEETLQLAVQRLRNVLIRLSSGGYNDWDEPSVDAQAEVLDRFQPMFARAHLSRLGETEFRSFLMFRNNRHWTGLERQGSRICRDMEALRQALLVLQDENQPIAERYNRVIGNIKGMGRAITTAVLLIMFPEKYGVWNKKSEAGLKMVELWPDFERGTSEAMGMWSW